MDVLPILEEENKTTYSKSYFIYNYNALKKSKNYDSQLFKVPEDMYKAILKNRNYCEKEVKLDESELAEEEHHTKCHNIPFKDIPKFNWEAFNSEIYCLELKRIKSPLDHSNLLHTPRQSSTNSSIPVVEDAFAKDYKNFVPDSPFIFCSNNQNNVIKIFGLFGMELCRCDLELPLPYIWNIPITRFDIFKQKYIIAKAQIIANHESTLRSFKKPLSKQNSMPEISKTKVMTFSQLLQKAETNQDANREPLQISLRKIESKRRPILYDEGSKEGQFLMTLDKFIQEKTKEIESYNGYVEVKEEDRKKIDNVGIPPVNPDKKDMIKNV